MSDEPILVKEIPKPADRSANKPIYIVIVDDPEVKVKCRYYKSSTINKSSFSIELRGVEITKAQADLVRENLNTQIAGRDINHEIPWHKVIRLENVSYRSAKQE